MSENEDQTKAISFLLRSFGRRQFLALSVAAVGAEFAHRFSWVAGVHAPLAMPPPTGAQGFLTAEEIAVLGAATAVIIPTDDRPGAREIGVVDYIQSLLSFLPGSDANCDRLVTAADVTATIHKLASADPACIGGGDVDGNGAVDGHDVAAATSAVFHARPVFAGGPFSGRQPQPHFPTGSLACQSCHGVSDGVPRRITERPGSALAENFPSNAFREHLPLPRLRAMSWKIRILGADAVPEAVGNPLATEMLETDLRRKYRHGLAALDAASRERFGRSFAELDPADQSSVLRQADPAFVQLLTLHTVEGMLCAPEYGGNRDRLGWQLIGFDGDSQPLGYTIYDPAVPGHYRERPDNPNSGPNPDEDCRGFSEAMERFLSILSSTSLVAPGGPFPEPYCLDVPP